MQRNKGGDERTDVLINRIWQFKERICGNLEILFLNIVKRSRQFWIQNTHKRSKTMPKKRKQSKASRLDESLGMRRGKESSKSQSYKSRRDESKASRKRKK